VHSVWMTELKFRIFTIDIGVWRELPEGTTNSIWIQYDHLKSIVSMLAIHLEPIGLFGQVMIVCRFAQYRVSISSGKLKPRSCVDFAQIVCQFRQVFIGVWLRFEKFSPRWRIIGREEIKA